MDFRGSWRIVDSFELFDRGWKSRFNSLYVLVWTTGGSSLLFGAPLLNLRDSDPGRVDIRCTLGRHCPPPVKANWPWKLLNNRTYLKNIFFLTNDPSWENFRILYEARFALVFRRRFHFVLCFQNLCFRETPVFLHAINEDWILFEYLFTRTSFRNSGL